MKKKGKNSNYKISFNSSDAEVKKSASTKKKIIALVLLVAVIAAAIAFVIMLQPGEFNSKDFTVYDMKGKPVSLSDYSGKPIVLNFWATWCGYCVEEMPAFQEMYEKYSGRVTFLMVNATDGVYETREKAINFYNEGKYTFPILFDSDSDAEEAYEVTSFPRTYFFDEKGNLIDSHTGAITKDSLEFKIDNLLN